MERKSLGSSQVVETFRKVGKQTKIVQSQPNIILLRVPRGGRMGFIRKYIGYPATVRLDRRETAYHGILYLFSIIHHTAHSTPHTAQHIRVSQPTFRFNMSSDCRCPFDQQI